MEDGSYDENDGQLSFIGEIATCLSLDARQSKMIAMGHVFGFLEEAIIMGNLFNEDIFINK